MPSFSESHFSSADRRTEIFYRVCLPDTTPVGTVQIAHGVAEHSGRYLDFMEYLAQNGYAVFANDHLGHGKSIADEKSLGFFAEQDGWNTVVRDMRSLHEIIRQKYPELPCFLFGHSMGSFLARTYLICYPEDLDGAVISGTGQQSALMVSGGKLMGRLEIFRHGARFPSKLLNRMAFGSYNKSFEPRRTEFDWLTRREDVVDAYIADPLCGFVASAGLFTDMMTGTGFISDPKNLAKMKKSTPVFFLSGSMDPVGENGKGVQKAYRSFLKAGMQKVSIRLYSDGRHEMLNELDRAEVWRDVLTQFESFRSTVVTPAAQS